MYQVPAPSARSLLLVAAILLLPLTSSAHSPHHVISDIASAPMQASDSHTFILITDQIFRLDTAGAFWKNLAKGLNNQYSFTAIKLSPDYESDKTLFAASSGDGVYRSTDYGESWQKVNKGLGSLDISSLSVSADFKSDHRLLAAANSGGVWRSVDGGDSWNMVLTETVKVIDFAEISISNERNIVIAGDSSGNVWRSGDSGRLWEIIHELPNAGAITSLSGSADQLYVGTEKAGLYRSGYTDGSLLQILKPQSPDQIICRDDDLGQPVSDAHITSVTVVPGVASETRILVTTWYGGVFISTDNARSWSAWGDGLSCDRQADRASAPHFRAMEITQLNDGNSIYWLGAFDGLFRSVGEELRWQQQETLPLGLIKGMAVSGGSNQPLVIAISTYGGGFYLTEDRGSKWTIGNKGLLTTRLTGLDFSPKYSEDGVIYAGAIRRLLKSTDRGQSWQRIGLQKPRFGRRILNKLNGWGVPVGWARSSGSASARPIYPTHIVALPADRSGRVLFATRYHGVMTFVESTGSIESLWSGTDQIINSLVISPDFEQDHTLFSSVRGQGVSRSEDGGIRWNNINSGLVFTEDWADNPERGDFRRDVFIAVSPGFSTDNKIYAGSPAGDGLYASHDRGNSWVKVEVGIGTSPAPVLAIAVSPEFATDYSLMVSIKGQGLFRSDDHGLHFEAVGEQLIDENAAIELLEYSPDFANDQSIVAASDEKLFLSEDGGNSWSELQRPVRYEDMRNIINFDDGWEQKAGEQYSALTETATSKRGSSARMRFVGSGIRWLGSQGPDYGSAQVFIDGELVATVSCRSDALRHMQEIFIVRGLEIGPHTIEIRANSETAGLHHGTIGIDAFDILPQAH